LKEIPFKPKSESQHRNAAAAMSNEYRERSIATGRALITVAKALNPRPDALRKDLLADTQPGWYARSRRLAQELSIPFTGSLASVFYRAAKSRILDAQASRSLPINYYYQPSPGSDSLEHLTPSRGGSENIRNS
jgi:hypothetical protein